MSNTPIQITAYRGQHGPDDPGNPIQSRGGSISFGSKRAAKIYATSPNDMNDEPDTPRIIVANLTINNPVINEPNDPFIDFSVIASALGQEKALIIMRELYSVGHIGNTDNFGERISEWELDNETNPLEIMIESDPDRAISELYVDAYPVFDEKEWVEWFREAGYDGAVHGGNGETALEAEYKVFDTQKIDIKHIIAIKDRTLSMDMVP